MYDMTSSDLRPRWEEFDRARGVWLTARPHLVRKLRAMPPDKLRSFLRVMVGLVRRAPDNEHGIDPGTGNAYEVPRTYARSFDRAKQTLSKAIKCGLLTLGGRSYKVRHLRPDTIQVTRAAGAVNYTYEALLDCVERGTL